MKKDKHCVLYPACINKDKKCKRCIFYSKYKHENYN